MNRKNYISKEKFIRFFAALLCMVYAFMAFPEVAYASHSGGGGLRGNGSVGGILNSGKTDAVGNTQRGEMVASSFGNSTSKAETVLYGVNPGTGNGSADSNIEDGDENEDDGVGKMLDEWLGSLFIKLSKEINELLSEQDIDLSIDGIVFGRMSHTLAGGKYVEADFTHFGLEENNPWGIIGASVYYRLREALLVLMPIVLMVMFLIQMIKQDPKGMAKLKDLLIHTVFVFALLFLLPYFLDVLVLLRDGVMYATHQAVHELTKVISAANGEYTYKSGGLFDDLLGNAASNPSLLNGLVLLASVFAGLFFLVDYIRIALWMMGAFALFPIFALISFWHPKKLNEWCSVFFPNFVVSFIDMILISVPMLLNALFDHFYSSLTGKVIIAVIDLIVIWNSVAVRNRLVKALGFDGIGGGANLGQMLNTLSHAFGGHGRGGRNSNDTAEKPSSSKDNAEQEERATRMGQEMDSAVGDMIEKEDGRLFAGQLSDVGKNETDAFLEDRGDGVGEDKSDDWAEDWDVEPAPEDREDVVANTPEDVDIIPKDAEPVKLPEGAEDVVLEDDVPVKVPEDADMIPGDAEPIKVPEDAGAVPGDKGPREDVARPEIPGDVEENDKIAAATPAMAGTEFKPSAISMDDYGKHYDQEFAESSAMMGRHREVARYENLARRDALKDKVSSNESIIQRAGYSRDTYDEDYSALTQRRDSISEKVETLKKQKAEMEVNGAVGTEEYSRTSDLLTKTQESYRNTVRQVDSFDAARKADIDNQAYRKEIEKCDRNEYRYAEINSYNGNSGRTYASADAFKHQQKVDEIKRAQMDYKNFDSAKYKGLLTPEEEAKYIRQREENRVRDNMVGIGKTVAKTTVKVAAGTVLGAAGAFAAGYGGTTASIGAALAGVKVAGSIVNNSGKVVERTSDVLEATAEGARLAKDHIRDAYTKGSERYKAYRDTQKESGKKASSVSEAQRRSNKQADAGQKAAAAERQKVEKKLDDIYDEKNGRIR